MLFMFPTLPRVAICHHCCIIVHCPSSIVDVSPPHNNCSHHHCRIILYRSTPVIVVSSSVSYSSSLFDCCVIKICSVVVVGVAVEVHRSSIWLLFRISQQIVVCGNGLIQREIVEYTTLYYRARRQWFDDERVDNGFANCQKYFSINSILRRQQTYLCLRSGKISVAEQMVNMEKPERGCKRWRAVFDRDGGEEQCSLTTIRPEVVWGELDRPATSLVR